MLNDLLDCIFGLCLFIGIYIMIGTFGTLEHGIIGFEQAMKQIVIGSVLMAVGIVGLTETDE